MSRALLVQVRQMWRSTLFDLSRDTNIRLIHSSDREVVLGVSRWNSFSTERGLESTKVCLDLLRKRTNLDDRELYKIVSSVETIGFNAVGQVRGACLKCLFICFKSCPSRTFNCFLCRCIGRILPKRLITGLPRIF
jgi:hypothetical protein